ncbi:MAG: MotA/TolQ/ExbB proton channel family protein [Lentimicrobium sp.]|nr:MotA/TolQ/ExbB proton channel family protein [Lentimicrobium sp.]
MFYKHLHEGSIPVMLPIYILWMVSIILIILLAYRLYAKDAAKSFKTKSLSELILFLGSFSFLWGIICQVIGLLEMLSVINEVGDIAPSIIAGGIWVSSLSTIYGLLLFMLTFVAWFVARRLNK